MQTKETALTKISVRESLREVLYTQTYIQRHTHTHTPRWSQVFGVLPKLRVRGGHSHALFSTKTLIR